MNKEGIDGVTGAEVADGTDECIKAVRRQIGAGADWIKVIFAVILHLNYSMALIYTGSFGNRSMQVNELLFWLRSRSSPLTFC